MVRTFLLAGVFLLAGAVQSKAGLVAYWNFNTLTNSTNNGTSYAPTTGVGTLNVVVANSDQAGTSRGITAFAGSPTNAIAPDLAGQSLAIQGGALESGTPTVATLNNGATITLGVSLAGLENPSLTFASQKSSTGFNSIQASYSSDGINFTNFGTAFDPVTSFASSPNGLQTFDFSAINVLDGDSSVFFRLTLNGADAFGDNARFDNFQINAITAVPEPTAMLMVGMAIAGCMVRRRRIG